MGPRFLVREPEWKVVSAKMEIPSRFMDQRLVRKLMRSSSCWSVSWRKTALVLTRSKREVVVFHWVR